jgi:preprotein translocase subunit YajC
MKTQIMAMASSPQTGAAAAGRPSSDLMSGLILPALLILALFYIMFILPQRKQQKQHETLIKSLKKGDEVITTGGIFATVVGFNERENTVYLKLGENVKIEVQRSSISGLRKKEIAQQPVPEAKK